MITSVRVLMLLAVIGAFGLLVRCRPTTSYLGEGVRPPSVAASDEVLLDSADEVAELISKVRGGFASVGTWSGIFQITVTAGNGGGALSVVSRKRVSYEFSRDSYFLARVYNGDAIGSPEYARLCAAGDEVYWWNLKRGTVERCGTLAAAVARLGGAAGECSVVIPGLLMPERVGIYPLSARGFDVTSDIGANGTDYHLRFERQSSSFKYVRNIWVGSDFSSILRLQYIQEGAQPATASTVMEPVLHE